MIAPRAQAAQVGRPARQRGAVPDERRRGHASRLERVTLPVTEYERNCLHAMAVHRGILRPVATRHGQRVKGVGTILLRTMSLESIVMECESLQLLAKVPA